MITYQLAIPGYQGSINLLLHTGTRKKGGEVQEIGTRPYAIPQGAGQIEPEIWGQIKDQETITDLIAEGYLKVQELADPAPTVDPAPVPDSPLALNATGAIAAIAQITDGERLKALLAEEMAGKNRATVIEAITTLIS